MQLLVFLNYYLIISVISVFKDQFEVMMVQVIQIEENSMHK